MERRYLTLNDIDANKTSFNLSNYIWEIVIKWEWFEKKHVEGLFVEAIDSVYANIAEDFGRYHKKDKIKFYRYSSGSTTECLDWNEKSKIRGLLSEEQYQYIFEELDKLPKELNQLIKFTNLRLRV